MQLAVAIAVDHRPHPVNVVGNLRVDAELVSLGAAIAKGSNTKYSPRMIRLCAITAKQRSTGVAGAGIDTPFAMAGTEHVLQITEDFVIYMLMEYRIYIYVAPL